MNQLNFPKLDFRFKNSENKTYIFDIIRKKFVVLQPEEWVRQHIVHYLIYHKNYPKSYINVEKKLEVNQMIRRYDIVVFNKEGGIELLVECKAPQIEITQEVFDQIARYNLSLKSNFLMVSNGLKHYYCQINYKEEHYSFIPEIPDFKA
jgi:hypothetical protein